MSERKFKKLNLNPKELIPLDGIVGIDPPAERPPVEWINVNGREEHEALLKDVTKMLELGLDPIYEKIAYLKRWGSWLGNENMS